MSSVARCSIYETRPQLCRDYPRIDHWTPSECTYHFSGSDRRGDCSCDVGACCQTPREKGEPGGAPLPAEAGGEPCKYLAWEDRPMEKKGHVALPIVDVMQDTCAALEELLSGPSEKSRGDR